MSRLARGDAEEFKEPELGGEAEAAASAAADEG